MNAMRTMKVATAESPAEGLEVKRLKLRPRAFVSTFAGSNISASLKFQVPSAKSKNNVLTWNLKLGTWNFICVSLFLSQVVFVGSRTARAHGGVRRLRVGGVRSRGVRAHGT